MKNFNELTRQGKARRLRQLAIDALQQYDLDVRRVSLLGMFTNCMFRVDTQDRNSYVLRICEPGWRTLVDLQSEIAWLKALANDDEIHAPVPQAAHDGKTIVMATSSCLPEPRRCMLMSWVPGVPLGRRLTPTNIFKMGILFARLHAFSAHFTPPPGFTDRKMSQVFAREEEVCLWENECQDAFSSCNRLIFEQTWERVLAAYQDLYANPAGLRVIHHDLWHDNIQIYRGRLFPVDFEDTVWGYPVQDLAMALQDLMNDVRPEEYEPYYTALRSGYESLSAWPETVPGQIDTFRAGRMIWVANWVACFQRQHLAGLIERTAPVFEQFLQTGLLRKIA